MYLFALSLRHPQASLKIREQFAIANTQILNLYNILKNIQLDLFCINTNININSVKQHYVGNFILSTCNRSEIYLYLEHAKDVDVIMQTWAQFCECTHINLHEHINIYCDDDAIKHLFEVMCGLDSMVLGETQIAKQIKNAYTLAHENNCLNPYLYALLQKTFKCAKQVRTDTNIGKFSISFASAGAKLAQYIFSDLSEHNILLIGAGDMMHHVLAHFSKHKPKHIYVANRSYTNAQNMLEKRLQNYIGSVSIYGLDNIMQLMQKADIIVCCIAYHQILITTDMVKQALKHRKYKPLCLLDLSVPMLMDMEIKKIPDAYLYHIDDLNNIIEDNQNKRIEAKYAAQIILSTHLLEFKDWYNHFQLKPLIHKLKIKLQQDMDTTLNNITLNINQNEYQNNLGQHVHINTKKMMQRNLHQWLQILPHLNIQQQNMLNKYLDDVIKTH